MKAKHGIVIAACAATLAGGLAFAEPGRNLGEDGRRVRMVERMARKLDLTEGQRVRMREIYEKHRAEGLSDAARNARQAHREMRRLIHDPAAGEDAVREAATKAARADADLAAARHRVFADAFTVLTPEQQEKAKAMRERVRSRVL